MSTVTIGHDQYQHLSGLDNIYLPHIKSGYGVDYTMPFIGGEHQISFPFNRIWDYYVEGETEPIHWYNLQSVCNALSNKSNYRYWSDFTGAHSAIMTGSDNITDADKAAFDADVAWIYGSLDDGGMFMVKSANDPSDVNNLQYSVCICYGLMEREVTNPDYSDGRYFYCIRRADGSNRQSLSRFEYVGFCIEEDEPDSIMSIYYAGTDFHYGNVGGYDGHTTPNVATGIVNWVAGLADPSWVDTPYRAWYIEGGANSTLATLYGFTLNDTIWISGNPFSEDENGSDPSGSGGVSTGGGGYGNPSQETGDEDFTDLDGLNLITAINSGLATLYNPTQVQLASFANFLYTGITENISAQIKKLIADPIDFVLFVALAKFTPPTSSFEEIGFAGIGSGVSAQKITNQFTQVDCGTIIVNEQFNSFLDFEGSVKLYLPFCGVQELKCDDVMGSQVHVKYTIDMLSGSAVAQIKCTRSIRSTAPKDCRTNDILYEFPCNVYDTMPITATDWRGAYQSLVGLAGGVVAGVATGGLAGATTLVSSAASAVTSKKLNVARSGQVGSNYGYLGKDKPFFIFERPIQSVPSYWGSFEGYMSNIRAKVGSLKGYTETDPDTIWTDNIHCTESEAAEIRSLFASGVYL